MKYSPTERIGVSHVENIFTSQFGWIFRDQPISDMGIDSHLEIVEKGAATGSLLALQIKTGESYFKKQGDDYVFYIKGDHYEYWLSHSLPVFLVMHNPADNMTLWQVVNERTTERLQKSWKLVIPSTNALDSKAKDAFLQESPSGELKRREVQLRLALPLLKAIESGEKVVLETQEWVHKSLNRGDIRISIDTDGEKQEIFRWPFFSTRGVGDMIEHFFPWFTVAVDEDFYQEHFEEDSVRDIFVQLPDLYPWKIVSGEFAEYRLQLGLSDLGSSYLHVERFLSNGEAS